MSRRSKVEIEPPRREHVLRTALHEGSAWEPSTDEVIATWELHNLSAQKVAAVKKFKARIGARKAKQFEKLMGDGETLSAEEATLYRAIVARANYLSMDRPDVQYATKELCRAFAQPKRNDYSRLKRLGRYLVGCPRLIWNSQMAKPPAQT